MNRLQNSICRFLKYVIELENLIIPQRICHSIQVPSIVFFLCRRRSGGRVQQEAIES